MIWLTWRQFRAAATMMAAALAALAAVLALSGPGLAGDYATGIAACTTQSGGCASFMQRFFQDHQTPFLAVTAVVLVLPALIGLFWGAPLLTRELEAGPTGWCGTRASPAPVGWPSNSRSPAWPP